VQIRLLVLDVDGVLTDGTLLLGEAGREWKRFCAADGLGLRLLREIGGVKVVLLTGRTSAAVARRAQELDLEGLIDGSRDKAADLKLICAEQGVPPEETAYMGDDLVDLPAMRMAGFSAAPSDARPEIVEAAHWVADSPGGFGAVRDLCDHLLTELGLWNEVLERYDP